MRRIRLMAVLGGLSAVMVGCGGGDEETPATRGASTAPATPAATQTPAAETAKASPESSERPDTDGDGSPDRATFRGERGDSFILVGQPGYKKPAKDAVKVTVLDVIGPFSGFNLKKGRQLIGVKVRFEGVGDEVYNNPQPHAKLTLTSGATGKQTSLITGLRKNPCDNKSLKLRKGKKVASCLAFEIPKKGKPKVFEYVAASGYGDTGLWQLR